MNRLNSLFNAFFMPNLKPVSFLIIISFLFASCRTQQSYFHAPPAVNYRMPEKKLKLKLPEPIKKEPKLEVAPVKSAPKIEKVKTYFPELKLKDKEVLIPAFSVKLKSEQFQQGPEPSKQKLKEKEKKKRKRRKFWRQFGANLLIGTVFLVIAVVMAVLKLQTLVLLFGVASILFLIFGLKKLFRKRRRKIRNPFQKNR